MRIKTESKIKIMQPGDVANIFDAILKGEAIEDQDKEHLWVMGVNSKNVVKFIEMVYLGSMDQSPVSPREVFRLAISEGVIAIVICHNHPSGDATPSQEDISCTSKLVEAGKLLNVAVLDHVVLGNGGVWVSLKAEGVVP